MLTVARKMTLGIITFDMANSMAESPVSTHQSKHVKVNAA